MFMIFGIWPITINLFLLNIEIDMEKIVKLYSKLPILSGPRKNLTAIKWQREKGIHKKKKKCKALFIAILSRIKNNFISTTLTRKLS